MKGHHQYVQGYNAQAVVTEDQVVLAAEITVEAVDFAQLRPMLAATLRELEQAGVTDTPQVVIADAGYWNEQHMDDVTADYGIQVLMPPDPRNREGVRPGWTGGRYSWMRAVLATPLGEWLSANDNRRSSRCSLTPSTTASSISSTDAAAQVC